MSAPASRSTGEITVHQCVVTVARRGGWSWGPAPRDLVDQVVAALPDLLLEHFAEQLTGDGPDVEITEAVTVTVRAAPHRWSGGAGPPFDVQVTPAPVVAETTPAAPGTGPESGPDSFAASFADSFAGSFAGSFATTERPRSVPPAAALFRELAERDELEALLALLPDASVRAYALALLGADDALAGRLLAELARRAPPDRVRGLLSAAPGDQAAPGAAPGTVGTPLEPGELTTLIAAFMARADREDFVRLADALPVPHGATTAARPPQPSKPSPAATPSSTLPPSFSPSATRTGERDGGRDGWSPSAGTPGSPPDSGPARSALASRPTGEARIRSVLPFLLAGPLARIGYLDAIGPALAGLELEDDAPLFAIALAYKVLGPTGRRWRRAEQDKEAAAVFAGLDPPVPEERLVAFARQARTALPVLDGVLALSVCRGHDPADPLLLTAADDLLLLVDAQGMFPIAWAPTTAELLPYWHICGRPPVLLCAAPPHPGVLRELAAAGVRFLTAVRPLRGDPVTRLPWRTPLWAGRGTDPDPRLATALPGHTERLEELVRALVTERRAVPLAQDGTLERGVTLAAALGLSTIAWTLWRDRETPDPLLALTRFADLEATVRFDPAAVRVRVPMGRRHADLFRSGLLADVPDVVWLGGRTLTFSGG